MKINRQTIITVGIFLLVAALLIILEAYPNFPDSDSFYHAKMATIIRDQGFIETFPWFQWMSWKDNYVDPHLLYHIILIPFVTFFFPMVGMKISAEIFGILAFAALYLTLRAFKIPAPWLFLLTAVLSGDFVFRMSMPRALALSVAIFLLGTWAIIKARPVWLLITATIFAWLYHGWPILLLSVLADFAATTISLNLDDYRFFTAAKTAIKKKIKIYLLTVVGLALGLVINPYFPQNLYFSFLDIFKIGIINYQSFLPVGQEWLPLKIGDLIVNNLILFSFFVAGLGFFLPALNKIQTKNIALENIALENKQSLFAFIFLAGGFMILTLKSFRFVEYTIPFLVLATGHLWKISQFFLKEEIIPLTKTWINKAPWRRLATLGFLTLFLGSVLGAEILNLTTGRHEYFQAKQYFETTEWLKKNIPAGETVFHNSWDFSPILWYLDDSHLYLSGLDPTFMYDYNPEAFNLWWNLSCGENPDVAQIDSFFHSRAVIVDRRFDTAKKLIANLENSGLFREVQKNDWVSVYVDYSL